MVPLILIGADAPLFCIVSKSHYTGPGQSYANAAGIYFKVLAGYVSWDIVASFMGVGGSMYLGAGTFRYIQVARISAGVARTTVR